MASWPSAAIGGFILALVTIFFPKAAPITAPIYAILEGLLLGGVSASFESVLLGHRESRP